MVFIDHLTFASEDSEDTFIFRQKRTCYDTYYPFRVLSKKGFERIDFSDITILYGGNGSGKSTALNIIAEKICADHDTVYNRSNFFEDYLELCSLKYEDKTFKNKELLTSDGVFDSMLDIRSLNQRIDRSRDEALDDYFSIKKLNDYDAERNPSLKKELEEMRLNPLENLDKYRRKRLSNTKTQSEFVRRTTVRNVREQSNGESAFEYFVRKIDRDGIYLLDEPENSLSPQKQQELVAFLENSVRFFNCQFVIATHSPFVLAIRGAKIYDLDSDPVTLRKWTELPNVRAYYDFFMKHQKELSEEI